jgi:hypothetical protein
MTQVDLVVNNEHESKVKAHEQSELRRRQQLDSEIKSMETKPTKTVTTQDSLKLS